MLRLLALAASFCITWLLPHPHPASWNSSPGHWDAVSQTWSPQNSHQRKHNSQLPGCDHCLSRQLQHPLFTVGQAAFFSLTKNTCGEGSGRSWTEGLCPCGVGVRYPLSTWTRSPARGSLNPVVQGFIEIPLQRRHLFRHRLLVIKAAPAPSRPGGCGVGLQVSALWSQVRFSGSRPCPPRITSLA